jgi:hypothetical protein
LFAGHKWLYFARLWLCWLSLMLVFCLFFCSFVHFVNKRAVFVVVDPILLYKTHILQRTHITHTHTQTHTLTQYYLHFITFQGVDINTQQSFEALNKRAVSVVVDPIQSVKGKVVIDAFRLINPQLMMMGQVRLLFLK